MAKVVIRTDDVDGFFSRAKDAARRADRGQPFDGKITGFEIKEQRGGVSQRPEQTCFANARPPEDHAFDATGFRHALIGGDNGECAGHDCTSSCATAAWSLPVTAA